MRKRLSAAEVAELAELLEEAPIRVGVIEDVLQAAAEGRGMTLVLADGHGDPMAVDKRQARRVDRAGRRPRPRRR